MAFGSKNMHETDLRRKEKNEKLVSTENHDYFSEESGSAFDRGAGCGRSRREVEIDVTGAGQSQAGTAFRLDLAPVSHWERRAWLYNIAAWAFRAIMI